MPNLDAARRRVEKLMTGTCTVTREPVAAANAILNETTFELIELPEYETEIYTGKCYTVRQTRIGRQGADDGTDQSLSSYFFAIPFGGPLLARGYRVAVTASADPALAGKEFQIASVDAGEITVWRSASMTLVESARDA